MSEEIHFLEDGYYVDKLEKDIQKLKEKCNQLQTMVKTYKEVIEEVREYIKENRLFQFEYDSEYSFLGISDEKPRKELSQILDKAKNV